LLILRDGAALERIAAEDVRRLTAAATAATFQLDGLTPEQIAANRRVVEVSGPTCLAAAGNDHQMLAAAFLENDLAGYVISTRHAPDDLELDWLMVHPRHHGSVVSSALMDAGMEWLGTDKALWLSVIRYNERAIRFYRRFGFEIDPTAATAHKVPHVIMRRAPDQPRR
jgi:ribosomal protein S18 acetylase RimI-like enzyme